SQRFGNAVDVVVYGHSHQPEIITRDGVLMVNPGSPTQRRFAPHHTYAIMQIDEEIGAELFTIESRV
ncbi:MAG: metallophosphoesterase family protein, partial [Chloroflexota bacterium]